VLLPQASQTRTPTPALFGGGDNSAVEGYLGESLVHADERLLLPWALALAAVTVGTLAALRTDPARRYLRGLAAPAVPPQIPR